MAYARRREHWVFIDSRGTGLYEKIKSRGHREFIGVWRKPGATFEELVGLAANHLDNYPFDVVYVIGGVNNITVKDEHTGKISFEWHPAERLIDHLTSILKEANERMTKGYPASKVVFCTLVGSQLSRIVDSHQTTDHQQTVVNEAVFDFNEEVFRINKQKGTFSPSLHRTIHRAKKGKRKSYYEHLSDGIHLQDHIKEKWADEIVKAATCN